MTNWIYEKSVAGDILLTSILILTLWLLRFTMMKIILRSGRLSNSPILIYWTKNLTLILLFVGLLFIWSSELRSFALTLGALSVAIAIAFREILVCFMGGVTKTGTGMFSIGDRLEVRGIRGDVIDYNPINTKLLEVGSQPSNAHTGRISIFPNWYLMTEPIQNESVIGEYIFHTFRFPMSLEDDWRLAEQVMIEACHEVISPYRLQVQKRFERFAHKNGMRQFRSPPLISIEIPDPGRVDLVVRVPTPIQERSRIEQNILRKFLDKIQNKPSEGNQATAKNMMGVEKDRDLTSPKES